ncbi:glycosyltransferase family 4 protein [Cellulophaga tyrosinoxydans]|uniref:Glycosyl transferases group 1 n=1 Tax=Cellulophaga tyrosinoxydans TaxID=504486 RepID=A0A1W2AQB9_9FLAO|nr:glycosyltransferase family 4 protein [Cellulophaga tyrosinoxydans]SMC62897.1 Glycosyl transferases group 1 [Cellulophaga tyrosinoxydans]
MKILWFNETGSLYDHGKNSYHGIGWVESLELLVAEASDLDLAICFFSETENKKVKRGSTTYYPLKYNSTRINPFSKLLKNWNGDLEDIDLKSDVQKVIDDFSPDVIHVFGTEGSFSVVQEFTNIPVVYHLQGLINGCINTFFPVNQSKWNFHLNPKYILNTLKGNNPGFDFKRFRNQALREAKVLENAKFVMGRTHWDRKVAELYNMQVKYYHVDEVLRPVFYEKHNLEQGKSKLRIVSTLSPTIYKGIDLVLKAAQKLKELAKINFQWDIIGLSENSQLLKHFEKSDKINHKKVGIKCHGVKSPTELIEILKHANVYVHPSYIDNSPNSICEAQILGLPVIACNVGGIASLIQNKETGILIPSNGVFELVHEITRLALKDNTVNILGNNARNIALERHDKEKILADLINVYKDLIHKSFYKKAN